MNILSQRFVHMKKYEISSSSFAATTHAISMIFGGSERSPNLPETFFDLYDFSGGIPSVHLIKVQVFFTFCDMNSVFTFSIMFYACFSLQNTTKGFRRLLATIIVYETNQDVCETLLSSIMLYSQCLQLKGPL